MTDKTELISELAENTQKTAAAFLYAIKFVYAISARNFYNVSIDEVVQISRFDVTEEKAVDRLGIRPEVSDYGAMYSDGFQKMQPIVLAYFKSRIPYFRFATASKSVLLKDKELKAFMNALDVRNTEDFAADEKAALKLAKKKKSLPPDSKWLRDKLAANFPEFSADNNRVAFLYGCIDRLLPVFVNIWHSNIERIILEKQ